MDRFGRRKLLLWGSVCIFVSHFVIAVLVGKYDGLWPTHKAALWASAGFLLLFILTFGSTWGHIPWAMPAEFFPSSLRAKGCGFGTTSNWGNNFIVVRLILPLRELLLMVVLGISHASNDSKHQVRHLCFLLLLLRSFLCVVLLPCSKDQRPYSGTNELGLQRSNSVEETQRQATVMAKFAGEQDFE
jgi:MFS family permease